MTKEFEMSEDDLQKILDVCKSVPMIALHCGSPPSAQENANAAWRRLGEKMGFKPMTVRPVSGKNQRFFTAEETETAAPEQEEAYPESFMGVL